MLYFCTQFYLVLIANAFNLSDISLKFRIIDKFLWHVKVTW
jgi:hypothetical protein